MIGKDSKVVLTGAAGLVGQNLVDNRHPEYANGLGGATLEVERSVYGKITFRF